MWGIPIALIVRLVAVAVIVGAAIYAKHLYDDHIRAPLVADFAVKTQGYKSTHDADVVTIDKQSTSLADITRKAGECSASITRIAGVSEEAGKQLAIERAKHAASDAAKEKRIGELASVAAGPDTKGEPSQVCEAARLLGVEYAKEVLGINK